MHEDLEVGEAAPDFRAVAVGGEYGEGREVTLSQLRGKPVVLYFYPKDDTPGCTTQACALRDAWSDFADRAATFGVSVDSPESHQRFIAKHRLPFPLLSDTGRKMVRDYHVWVEKSMYGKKYMGAERSTFVIGPDGNLAAIHRKVKPEEHVHLLEQALASMGPSKN